MHVHDPVFATLILCEEFFEYVNTQINNVATTLPPEYSTIVENTTFDVALQEFDIDIVPIESSPMKVDSQPMNNSSFSGEGAISDNIPCVSIGKDMNALEKLYKSEEEETNGTPKVTSSIHELSIISTGKDITSFELPQIGEEPSQKETRRKEKTAKPRKTKLKTISPVELNQNKKKQKTKVTKRKKNLKLEKFVIPTIPAPPPVKTYCICNRILDEDMVGCDGANCKREWFHFACVGITDASTLPDKWYCADCL